MLPARTRPHSPSRPSERPDDLPLPADPSPWPLVLPADPPNPSSRPPVPFSDIGHALPAHTHPTVRSPHQTLPLDRSNQLHIRPSPHTRPGTCHLTLKKYPRAVQRRRRMTVVTLSHMSTSSSTVFQRVDNDSVHRRAYTYVRCVYIHGPLRRAHAEAHVPAWPTARRGREQSTAAHRRRRGKKAGSPGHSVRLIQTETQYSPGEERAEPGAPASITFARSNELP